MSDIVTAEIGPFPRTYQLPVQNRILPVLWVTPLFILAMFGRSHLNSKSPIGLWLFAIAGLIFILFTFLGTASCKVTLYADRIEKQTWLWKKTIKKSDLGRLRKIRFGLMILSFKYNKGDGMVFPKGIGGDAVWTTWMASLEVNDPN